MDEEEIVNNVFYLLLKNKYKNKHDEATSKCCTICVPCSNSLRGIKITETFIDDHILQQNKENPQYFTSRNGDIYYLNVNNLKLINKYKYTDYKTHILFYGQNLNSKYKTYSILILEKPINPSYLSFNEQKIEKDITLEQNIYCFKDALKFLNEVTQQSSLLDLKLELAQIDFSHYDCGEKLRDKLKDLLRQHWAKTMRSNSLELQRDGRFQSLLSKALEIFVMHHLHQDVYAKMAENLHLDDSEVNSKLETMHRLQVTPEQLGFAELSDVVELPSATDELSHLDQARGPWEKFICLRNCLDLVLAEFKGVFADVKTTNDEDCSLQIDTRNVTSVLSMSNFVKLLVYVLAMSRPSRLVTDLYYIRNFLWSVSPDDKLWYTLAVFTAVMSAVYEINVHKLHVKFQINKKTEEGVIEKNDANKKFRYFVKRIKKITKKS